MNTKTRPAAVKPAARTVAETTYAALKEDVRVEKFGHREAILRAVLSN